MNMIYGGGGVRDKQDAGSDGVELGREKDVRVKFFFQEQDRNL